MRWKGAGEVQIVQGTAVASAARTFAAEYGAKYSPWDDASPLVGKPCLERPTRTSSGMNACDPADKKVVPRTLQEAHRINRARPSQTAGVICSLSVKSKISRLLLFDTTVGRPKVQFSIPMSTKDYCKGVYARPLGTDPRGPADDRGNCSGTRRDAKRVATR